MIRVLPAAYHANVAICINVSSVVFVRKKNILARIRETSIAISVRSWFNCSNYSKFRIYETIIVPGQAEQHAVCDVAVRPPADVGPLEDDLPHPAERFLPVDDAPQADTLLPVVLEFVRRRYKNQQPQVLLEPQRSTLPFPRSVPGRSSNAAAACQ